MSPLADGLMQGTKLYKSDGRLIGSIGEKEEKKEEKKEKKEERGTLPIILRDPAQWLPIWGAYHGADLRLSSWRDNAMDIASLTIALLRT